LNTVRQAEDARLGRAGHQRPDRRSGHRLPATIHNRAPAGHGRSRPPIRDKRVSSGGIPKRTSEAPRSDIEVGEGKDAARRWFLAGQVTEATDPAKLRTEGVLGKGREIIHGNSAALISGLMSDRNFWETR